VAEDLLLDGRFFLSSVEYPFVSDHALILLQLENVTPPKAYPYKFNLHCLSEKEYNNSVKILWNDQVYL
jgi:hypothetical protein